MDVVIQTRFSYLGQSGWRSAASRDPGRLFDPQRLERRFALFEKVTLPSLQQQSDGDFRLIVLSSATLPEPAKLRLEALVSGCLGSEKARVKFVRPGFAAKKLAAEVAKDFGDRDRIAEVVLDDDDALSLAYVQELRQAIGTMTRPLHAAGEHMFLSFPRGLSMFARGQAVAFEDRMVRFTNLGLALICKPGSGRNVYAVAHKRIGERHPHAIIDTGNPAYVRCVHGANDSRAMTGSETIPVDDIAHRIGRFFPHLPGLDPALLA